MTRVKTTFDPVKGVFEERVADGDEQVVMQGNAKPVGFQASTSNATTVTTNTTLGVAQAGSVIVSASNGAKAITVVMPLASTCAGTLWTFRNTSLDAHILTCSLETAGATATRFCEYQSVDGALATKGSALTFPAVLQTSAVLVCDGVNWVICGASGSLAVTGA